MGGSISKQQRQQIATYRARFILGESNLNLMNDQDLQENEVKCRNVTENYNLDKKKILQEILQKVESEPDNIIDNNGILLCNSEKIIEILQSHLVKSPKYIEEELLKSIKVQESSNQELNKQKDELTREQESRSQEQLNIQQESRSQEQLNIQQENRPQEQLNRQQESRPQEQLNRPQESRPQEQLNRPQESRPQEQLNRPQENRSQENRQQLNRQQESRPQSNQSKSFNKAFGGSIKRNSNKKSVKLYY
jgi:hypothetical protein